MTFLKKISSIKKVVIIIVDESGQLLKAGITGVNTPLQTFESLGEIMKHFGKSKPAFIQCVGTGVLSRKVLFKENYRQELILNGDQNDFIFTSFSDEKQVAVSFVRKAVLQPLLNEIEEKKIHLLGVTCGPALFFGLNRNFDVNFDFHVALKEGGIDSFQKEKTNSLTHQFEGESLNQFDFTRLCVLNLLNNKVEGFDSFGKTYCEEKRLNFNQFRRFKTMGFTALLLLLFVVIGNRVYQNHLQNTITELENDLNINQQNTAYLDRLISEKNRKLELIANAGVVSKHFLGQYLDEIGKSVPKSIQLTSLELFPVDGKLKNKERVKIQNQIVLIKGVTDKSVTLDNWMEELTEMKWVQKVELTNYIKNEYGKGDFTLFIELI